MNSTTPGTLISYRFSPGSCCISSHPTISPPVTAHPFNVNLSPFSRAPCSYRGFFFPTHTPADCQKKNISFFHLTHCYPSARSCLPAGHPQLCTGTAQGEEQWSQWKPHTLCLPRVHACPPAEYKRIISKSSPSSPRAKPFCLLR